MVTENRWKDAQSYEQGYWDSVAQEAAEGDSHRLGFYQWRADQLRAWLDELGLPALTGGDARVIEIGSGPIGVAGFLPAAEQVAVDPLEDFYSSRPALVADRPASVSYRAGTGEALPAEDGRFQLAIIENCIDHCQDMDAVMADIRRVLAPGGYLYLTVNNRSRPGYFVHRLLSSLKIDPGHPHTFTLGRTRRFVEGHGFEILGLKQGSWLKAWREDLAGPGMKQRAKAVLGVSEFLVSVVGRLRG